MSITLWTLTDLQLTHSMLSSRSKSLVSGLVEIRISITVFVDFVLVMDNSTGFSGNFFRIRTHRSCNRLVLRAVENFFRCRVFYSELVNGLKKREKIGISMICRNNLPVFGEPIRCIQPKTWNPGWYGYSKYWSILFGAKCEYSPTFHELVEL